MPSLKLEFPDKDPYRLAYDKNSELVCVRGSLSTVERVLRIPGARVARTAGNPTFVAFPATRDNIIAAEAISTPELMTQDYLGIRAEVMRPDPESLERVQQLVADLPRKLLHHQLEACAWAVNSHRQFNASEQGTGKTTVGWVMAHLWNCERVVIVCPKSLTMQWQQECQDTLGDYQYEILRADSGPVDSRSWYIRNFYPAPGSTGRRAVILNYDVLTKLLPALQEFSPDYVIYDESWKIKNRTADVTEAAIELAGPTHYAMLLTGTPIGNDIGDLYSQALCLDESLELIPYWSFMHQYAVLIQKTFGNRLVQKAVGCSNPVSLMQYLARIGWYRATKASCLSLPPKKYRTIKLPLNPQQQRLYDDVLGRGEIALGNELSLAGEMVTLLRLQQICGGFAADLSPEMLTETEDAEAALVPLERCALQQLGSPKYAWIKDFLRDEIGFPTNRATRVLIWCRFNAEVDYIHEALTRDFKTTQVVKVKGSTSNETLEEWKKSFNSRDEEGVVIMVLQISKMAFGQNLQAGDYNIYYSNSHSYVMRAQSEDRTHRMGREGGVEYIDLVATITPSSATETRPAKPRQSVDERVIEALQHKMDLAMRLAPDTVSGWEGDGERPGTETKGGDD